jgi:hypothetical protein
MNFGLKGEKEMKPTDVIEVMLHFLGAGYRLPADISRVHRAFYVLHQDSRFSKLMQGFVFNSDKLYPDCNALDTTFHKLESGRLLVKTGTGEMEITDKLASKKFEKGKVKGKNKNQLKLLATELKRQLNMMACTG